MLGIPRRLAVAIATKYVNEAFRGLHLGGVLTTNNSGLFEISIPEYKANPNETIGVKKARLLYQSRKRGMLENDLLLSTFVDRYLEDMDTELLEQYDQLINSSYSDWDIYYWVVGSRPTPPDFENRVMALLKEHVKNSTKEKRIRQPDLPIKQFEK